jgi:dTDP-4-amino-4,6-dideoxygalactose transaminase
MSRGAKPVFVDVDMRTLNIDPKCIEQAITSRTRAICVVHYAGVPVDLDEIMRLCKKHNLFLVEDNAHGLFSKYKGRNLGTFGDLATLSFHETKNITCGEGGALLINSAQFVDRAEILREKGTDRTKFLRGQVDKYTWVDIGSSWVMSDILAAILASQLERASDIQKKRENIFNFYQHHLDKWSARNDIRIPFVPDNCEHSSHMYYLRLPDGLSRDRFISHMKDHGVSAVFHYQPLHLSAVGKSLGGFVGQCPVSEEAGDCLVRLPLFTQLTTEMLSQIADAVTSFSV